MTTPAEENHVLDLGRLDGPVLCFGGPYSNAQATEAMLAEALTRGIPSERVICTGDVVAYGGDPQACIDLVREAGIRVVMGNCEESLGFNAADCNCGFEKDSDCAAWSTDWFAHAAAVLDGDALAWMRALPRQLRFTMAGRNIAVIHGGDQNISEYVFASTPDAAKAEIIDRLDADAVIGGHSGLPFTQVLGPRVLNTQNIGGRLWHNPGAIGMPANDGTPRVWYSVLAETPDGLGISHLSLDYDHAAAARAMRAGGLPEAYARTIEDGLWPNMDVMSPPGRALRGRRIRPWTALWPAG